MSLDRLAVAHSAADRLEAAGASLGGMSALVGFDGFIDAIIRVVDRRRDMSPRGYQAIRTIAAFAERIAAAAGRSANLEWVVEEERFGGNGPLMAGALGRLGVGVTFIGAVGKEGTGRGAGPLELHPTYAELAGRCRRVIPVAPPAHTDALEFDDGKIMFGQPANVQAVTWERLKDVVGLEEITRLVEVSQIFGIVNWTLCGGVEGIWKGLVREVLPRLKPVAGGPRRMFIDISDPAKRTDEDLARAMVVLSRMAKFLDLTLGLNLAEAERVVSVLGVRVVGDGSPSGRVMGMARAIRERLLVGCVMVHPCEGAGAADETGVGWFDGPFTRSPRLSTGAGDHVNAGFVLARALGMTLEECLAVACAESGVYVREGESPDPARLCGFLRALPEAER